MFYTYNTIIPKAFALRLLPLMTHLVLLILLVLDPHPQVRKQLELQGSGSEDIVLRDYYLLLYLSIGFLGAELISYLSAYTSFYFCQTLLSLLAHTTAICYLFPFYLDVYGSSDIRWIFGFCTVLPFITELYSYLRLRNYKV